MTVIETNRAGAHIEGDNKDYGGQWATLTYLDPTTGAEVDETTATNVVRNHWVHDNTAQTRQRVVAVSYWQSDGMMHRLSAHGPALSTYAESGNENHEFWEHGKRLDVRDSVWHEDTSYGWTITKRRHTLGPVQTLWTKHYDSDGYELPGVPISSDEYDAAF